MGRALDELLGLLELDRLGGDRFVGSNESEDRPHLFGGQLTAQALAAACGTAKGLPAHSLHGHFLGHGNPGIPVTYSVERLRDGEGNATRRVTARQADRTISTMTISLRRPGSGFEHGASMPRVAEPESLPCSAERSDDGALPAALREWELRERPIDLRFASGPGPLRGDGRPGPLHLWLRAAGDLPHDPLVHQCVAAYALDYGLLETALRRHVLGFALAEISIVGLDLTLWFHRAFRMDRWHLNVLESPSSASGLAFVRGSLFDQNGTIVASVAGELLMRPVTRRPY